jgi:glycosyltransferase involved in cell wall biosynthesis
MKILIFNSLYYPNIVGGAEIAVQKLAEGLLNKGYTPVIISTSQKDHINYINGIKVYYIENENIYWFSVFNKPSKLKKLIWHLIDIKNIFLQEKIHKILLQEKPDIIHTHNLAGFSVIVWELATKFKVPIIHTLHDYYLLCPSSTMFKGNKPCNKQCLKCKFFSYTKRELSNKYVNIVTGVSNFILKKHLDLGYFRNALEKKVIPNQIELPKSLKHVKEKKNKDIILGFVGRISPEKGLDLLLEVFQQLHLKDVKLYIFGKSTDTKYEEYLKFKYSKENIVFKGFKPASEIYSQIDITIVPSLWHEPFARVVIESYSYGIPVLASRRGGIPENVIEGITGFLFEPNDLKDFKLKMHKIIDLLRKGQIDSNKIRNFAKKFSSEIVLKQYIDTYNKLLNSKN